MSHYLPYSITGFVVSGLGFVYNNVTEAYPWLLSNTGIPATTPYQEVSNLTFTGAALLGCYFLFRALLSVKDQAAAAQDAQTKAAAALAVSHSQERQADAERHAKERIEESHRHASTLAAIIAEQREGQKEEHAAAEVSRAEMNLRLKILADKMDEQNQKPK